MICCCWLSESDASCKCDTDVRFLSIPAPIFSLGKLLLFYTLGFFSFCRSQWELFGHSFPSSFPPLKQHQLFICIYGAQLCVCKIGLRLHGGLENSARGLSLLPCCLTHMGSVMELSAKILDVAVTADSVLCLCLKLPGCPTGKRRPGRESTANLSLKAACIRKVLLEGCGWHHRPRNNSLNMCAIANGPCRNQHANKQDTWSQLADRRFVQQ